MRETLLIGEPSDAMHRLLNRVAWLFSLRLNRPEPRSVSG
jgi:hypothetical protein